MGVQAVMSSDMPDSGLLQESKLPTGVSSVLAVLLSSAVVLDSDDRVLNYQPLRHVNSALSKKIDWWSASYSRWPGQVRREECRERARSTS